ncbi:DUF4148 domain-containing protein [Variovorax sp. VNK109]|jgi:hypothetical protein|uniref:DUF4148 domain-containing protein n=1 Tax=Variovorax sp. VNK109 TaxID=3400919 RepID=UPI003C0A8666
MKIKSTLIVLSLIAAPAFASDQVVSKTREQVRAELVQAQKRGEMLASGESGLTLKQINPAAYPVTASTQAPKTREQVRAELDRAIQTGEMLAAGESGAKLNELVSRRYPAIAVKSYKSRDEVKSELARAIREGEVEAVGEDGRKLNEIYPDRYHAAQHAAVSAEAEESAKASHF